MEALVSAVEGLRDAVGGASLPLDVTEPRPGRGLSPPAPPAARRLRAAAPAGHRRTAARRGRRLHRCRQVDPGQLGGRRAGEPLRRAPAHHHVTGARAPPRRPALVRRHPHPARARAGHRPGHRREPARHRSPGRVDRAAGGHGTARRPRHRLRRLRQPRHRDPAALGRRSLALRHHRGALRGCRAVGPPAHRRRPGHLGRDRARPHPPGCRGRDPPAPRRDAARAGAADGPHLHRPRDHAQRRGAPAPGCRGAAALVAPGAGQRRPRPLDRRRADPARRRRLALRAHRRARRRQPRPARRGGVAAQGGRRVVQRGAPAGRRRHDRRHPAARRGAGPLAGVRRHRRVLPPGREHDRPAGATRSPPPSRATRRRPTTSARRCRAGSPRCCSPMPRRPRPRPPAPGAGCPAAARSSPRTPTSPSRRRGCGPTSSGSCATGRARCSSWCAPKDRAGAPTRASRPTAQRDRAVPDARGVQQHGRPHRCRGRHRRRHRRCSPSACSRRSSATRRCATWPPRPAAACSTLADELFTAERERYAAALAEVAAPADQAKRLAAVAGELRAVVR